MTARAAPPAWRVRVVVVHYGDPDLTLRCLRGVAEATWPADHLDVVVVDNDPIALDVAAVVAACPGAHVVRSGTNLGFAGGANLGIGLSEAGLPPFDAVALLNNDAVPEAGWLEPLAAALDADTGLGAACSKIVLEEPPGTINSAGLILVEHGFGADRGYLEPDRGQYDEPAEVFGWCGGAVLLRRAYLDDAGLLDERYFAYYEDFDLSWRGRLLGWRYQYVPASVVHHRHAASLGVGSERFRHLVARNRLLTLVKLAPWRMAARAFAVEAKLAVVGGPGSLGRQARILGGTLRHLPGVLTERVRLRRRRSVSDDAILAWLIPRPARPA